MDEELVTVAGYRFATEAELAKMHLEEAGIPAFLADAETVNMDWLLGNAIGDIKVQVARSQAEAATEVLAARQNPPSEAEEDDEPENAPAGCLSCGKEIPEGESKCPACGWTYEGAQESDA